MLVQKETQKKLKIISFQLYEFDWQVKREIGWKALKMHRSALQGSTNEAFEGLSK